MAQHETNISFKRTGTYLFSCWNMQCMVTKNRTYKIYMIFLIDFDVEKLGLLNKIEFE